MGSLTPSGPTSRSKTRHARTNWSREGSARAASRGESVAQTAARYGVYFSPGDPERIAGWMQCHYRLPFDENGYPRMYVFRNCRAFILTVPLMLYSQTRPEDLDTALEDHVCDEWRYFCMSRPVRPIRGGQTAAIWSDPLDQLR